jgi:fatty acid amide hydrolase 2
MLDDLLLLSAAELARRIRARQLSSHEVVGAHIRHVEQVNPHLNALVAQRFEEALRDATRADQQVAAGEALGPLHGVPCSIKEAFALRGMPHSSGLVSRKHRRAEEDAPTVARLRAAGAIPLGVSNVSELCMWMESNNRVYGRTNNPYDAGRTAGGSSGGEGAIVGAGGAPFGLGSDIGGSIRMPAFFNGVFGHKPSPGLVPNRGQYPMPDGPIDAFVATGPITRRAEDLFPLLQVLADDPGALRDPQTVSAKKLRVISVEDDGRMAVTDELRRAQARAAEALAARGATVVHTRFADFRHAIPIWSALLDETGGPSFAELLGDGVPVRAGRELLRWATGRSAHTFPAIGLALIEPLPKIFSSGARRFIDLGARLREELSALLGEDGVLLYPPHPRVAPRHGEALARPLGWTYTALFNALRLPVTQVPLGLSAKGLPLGVQVVASPHGDHRSLAVARWLEEDFGGWVPPTRFFAGRR